MEAYVFGRIKSDGYRFLAKLYRFIWDTVEKTGTTQLDPEDKGYLAYFCNKLNQFELLKRKKEKLLSLVAGLSENTRRLFKREMFRMYFDEPKGQDTIDNYNRYYDDRMKFTGEGKELLIEKATLASEVRKLIKYYNYMFYHEVCPQHIRDFCADLIRAKDKSFEFLASELEKLKNMPALVIEAIAEHIPPKIRGKIFHQEEDCHSEGAKRCKGPLENKENSESDGSDENGESIGHDENSESDGSDENGESIGHDENGESRHSCGGRNPDHASIRSIKESFKGYRLSGLDACLSRHDENSESDGSDENGESNGSNENGESVGHDHADNPIQKSNEMLEIVRCFLKQPEVAFEGEPPIPHYLSFNFDQGSDIIEAPSNKKQDIAEYKNVTKILRKTEELIYKNIAKGTDCNRLITHGMRLKLRQFFVQKRLEINHNYEVRQNTERIG